MLFLTDANTWRIGGGILGLILCILGPGYTRRTVGIAVLAVVIADVTAFQILKPIFARPRPFFLLTDVHVLHQTASYHGFPSNHAANLAAMAFAFTLRQRGLWGWIMFPLAFLVGFSRIWVGVHYPLDVLAGWVWGAFVAWGLVFLLGKLERSCHWE